MVSSPETAPVTQFTAWLPGEMVYSARKAGYAKKVERAARAPEDRTSIHGFLGTEWSNFRQLRHDGVLHVPHHGMSAQLQLAKFAAGVFDKVALGDWLLAGQPEQLEELVRIAEARAVRIAKDQPWQQHERNVRTQLDAPFERTEFSPSIKMWMKHITGAVPHLNSTHDFMKEGAEEDIRRMMDNALLVGGTAVRCYELFALENLTDDQQTLPDSQLSD